MTDLLFWCTGFKIKYTWIFYDNPFSNFESFSFYVCKGLAVFDKANQRKRVLEADYIGKVKSKKVDCVLPKKSPKRRK